MKCDKTKRNQDILRLFRLIEKSGSSAKEYFATHKAPIGLSQYYRLKKRYSEEGVDGLVDQRAAGNARKVSSQQEDLIRGVLTYNRHLPSKSLKRELKSKWKIEIDQSRIDQFRRQFGLTRIKQADVRREKVPFVGIEVFSALVYYVGILDHFYEAIQIRLDQIKQTDLYKGGNSSSTGDHINARRKDGKFSPRYNRLSKVRKMKYASIEDKITGKDFSRLSLYQTKKACINRKNLAIMLLPLVTNNGVSRDLNKPLGNALKYACGYNYKNATIDKQLRELKYLRFSTELIDCNARFWNNFWKQYDPTEHKLGCYYIDGNVKPLWSSKRCRKGKVTMLGRVMSCLEQVVIHDGFGRPIYFRTFSGNADLQKNALKSMEQLDDLINEGQKPRNKKARCNSALVMDGGGNSVETLRAFSNSDYHYITILDTNQIRGRKFKLLSAIERYRYGAAGLKDCRIELLDSKERGYLFESRAVRVFWDNGRECCLVTSISKDVFDASEVVKAYFDRWPLCERQYAMMKAAVCFHQVVGYGKKQVDNEKMIDRISKSQITLKRLQRELKIPLSQIATNEEGLFELIQQERKLKENSKITKGKRVQSNRNKEALEDCQRKIRKISRKSKQIEKPFKKEFVALRKEQKEFSRIQGKQKVFHADVELDQLVTSFRLAFANILAFLAMEILGGLQIEMNTLIQSILFLSGTIERQNKLHKVIINVNKKDPKFMAILSKGLTKINDLKIRRPSGAIYKFEIL